MKNIFFALVLVGGLGDLMGQGRQFFDPKKRDCVQLGVEKYPIIDLNYSNYSEYVIALRYSHDFFRLKNYFLRARTGIDCFLAYGFHLQTGLAVGARLGFLEISGGPVLHGGDFFREQNSGLSRFGFGGPPVKQNYFKTSLNIAGSVTVAKTLVLGIDWQWFKTTKYEFSPSSGILQKSTRVWARSSAVRLGFWF